MAKKTKKTMKKAARKAARRDVVRAPTATSWAKRDRAGQFTELDETGRSLASDRRTKAKTTVPSGFGDQGDQPARKTRKRTAKKR
jgi:hypothetical protein